MCPVYKLYCFHNPQTAELQFGLIFPKVLYPKNRVVGATIIIDKADILLGIFTDGDLRRCFERATNHN